MVKARVLAVLAAAALVVAPALPAQAAVTVKATQNLTFKPKTLSIHKGTKVVWKNVCSCDHTVTSTSNNWSKNAHLNPGDTTSHTFKRNGTYRYKCTIHAGMTGKVVVG
jgi:plastocyanin